ncbi:MFS transporter [Pelotomaculum sp. PtaB.Bin117]|uniref:MFS transporter n=1 Tax=Pelotomaculum sp. PtaB.Bin117 TaxID=1811694 RepID=UPI0009CFE4A8|nr:MFS transporter [Pelotomaculum sp. PtaB.Bin117]OPX90650.1 MAG: enterobactin exporter EntS [Pelotomaculum sp. PtaB.Bin117]
MSSIKRKPDNNTSGLKFTFRSFRYRNYRLFFGGQGISLVGTWIQNIAMSWLVYDLTNSAFLLGIVGFAGQIPTFFLTPFAGVLADRLNRRRILLVTQTLSMTQAFILAILVLTGNVTVWHIIPLSFFLGLINSFDMPTRQSFVVDIVDKKEDLGNAIALNSSMFNGARLVGPSIAGILIATVGEGICFLLNGLSYIAVIIALLAMSIEQKEKVGGRELLLNELKEGFAYAFGYKPIRYIIFIIGLVSLVGMPYTVLMPVFAKEILNGGAHTLGFLMGASGTGALIGAVYLASRKELHGLGRNMTIAVGVFGVGLVLFSLSKSFWPSMLLMLITGFGMITQMASCNTMLQIIVDDEKRGRVMSFYTMAFMGMAPVGSLLAGSLAHIIGTPETVLASGIFCIIGSIAFAGKLPLYKGLTGTVNKGKV